VVTMGPRLDVIAELAAHQQNLAPSPVAATTAVLGLPLGPVWRLIGGGWLAAHRRAALAALAEELGGGDGPLPIVDLDEEGGPLVARLTALWQGGVRHVVLHGHREQPGFARAVRYRWPGGLALDEAGGVVDALLDPCAPVRRLGPGVVAIAPGTAVPADELVLAAVDERADPRELRALGDRVWPYAIDPARRLGAWAGALPPGAAIASGGALRARWDAHWTALGAPDVVRQAVLGLDPALERTLRHALAPRPATPRCRLFAVTGIDGAGKSSHAGRLARTLHDAGAHVRVLKLSRQGGFLELANELGARTRRGAPLAAFRTSRIVKLIDSLRVYRDHLAPALDACDAVVMDRYSETHVAAAASQLGWDLRGHPALAPFPPPDLRVWLALDPAIALRRRDARGEPPSADEHAVGLHGYAREFARLADGAGEVVLDATAPADDNARLIAGHALARMGRARGPAADSSFAPPAAVPAVDRAGAPCRVRLGPGDPSPELGADVLALRRALDGWCPGAAAAIDEGFWLEAYAAQMILDARTRGHRRAWLALWPGALARMASHRDLTMLPELDRLLAASVEVDGHVADAAAYAPTFAALGAQPSAAARLAREYAVALGALGDAAGWPAVPMR
jgi:thymidylate kinase